MQHQQLIQDTITDFNKRESSIRIMSKTLDGKKLWFKRHSNRNFSIGRVAHRLGSFLVLHSFLKATPLYKADQALSREVAKLKKFQECGFNTPELIYTSNDVMVLSDAGDTLEQTLSSLRKTDPEKYDELLCQWVHEFGKIHKTQLCHGRPHLRDTTFHNDKWTFLDFEEHPEEVMPIEVAQARDLLLIFHGLSRKMLNKDNFDIAMQEYRKNAPEEVLNAMRKILKDIGFVIAIAKFLDRLNAGKDIKQFVLATNFLKQNLELN